VAGGIVGHRGHQDEVRAKGCEAAGEGGELDVEADEDGELEAVEVEEAERVAGLEHPALRVPLEGGEAELVLGREPTIGGHEPGAVAEAAGDGPGHAAGEEGEAGFGGDAAEAREGFLGDAGEPGDLLVGGEAFGLEAEPGLAGVFGHDQEPGTGGGGLANLGRDVVEPGVEGGQVRVQVGRPQGEAVAVGHGSSALARRWSGRW
jgi:hypothetical protein